ncbi:MAG: DNA starvation/stationary phase protection protein [Candidatus Peribacteraceae bacterium]|nr:DNA starvation/stationary phase protection protein [Candidatus Peribacteraceae bacterium]
MSATAHKDIITGLSRLLGSTYVLTIKLQHFHWNVTGPLFAPLHAMFEGQYTQLFTVNDDVAERIRALGETAPGTAKEFLALSVIKEQPSVPSAKSMLAELLKDYEKVIALMGEIATLAGDADDHATNDLLAPLMRAFEKTAWMVRSSM